MIRALAFLVISILSPNGFGGVLCTATSRKDVAVSWKWEFMNASFPIMFGQVCHSYTNGSTQEDQLLVYAGYHQSGPSNDLYRYDFPKGQLYGVIQHGVPGGSIPFGRGGAASILSPSKRTMMVFGGSQSPAEALDDTWELDIGTFTWTEYTAGAGQGPSRRYASSTVYVPEMDCALLFAGSFWKERLYYNDLWCYSFSTHKWTARVPSLGSSPAPRFGHTAVYYDGYMYIYGGGGNSDVDFTDVWAFSIGKHEWGEVLSQPPPGRAWMRSVLIDAHWVVVGGARNSTDNIEVWRWPISPSAALGSWQQVDMAGVELVGRESHCLLNHRNGSAVYMLGGYSYERKGSLAEFVRFFY
eukprot:scpid81077/ scgid34819/ Ras guanine nucleotide exchange factor F; RasGEF domain-containing protein F